MAFARSSITHNSKSPHSKAEEPDPARLGFRLYLPSIMITKQSPKRGGNDSRFPALYNDFRRSCQTKKDFITLPFSGPPVLPGQSVDTLIYASWGCDFRKRFQIESVRNSPSAISCKAALINFNRSRLRSFEEWIGRRRHLSLTKPLLSMNC